MRILLVALFIIFPVSSHAAEKGDKANIGIVCIEPTIIQQITTAAQTSIDRAGATIASAELAGVCVMKRFNVTLVEKTGEGIDVGGFGYELWTVESNGLEAYTYIAIPPSI